VSGVRLHHPTLRAGEGTTLTYVVELPQPYSTTPKPGARLRGEILCPTCGKTHANKAVHLRLDAHGDVIVSPAVFLALQSAFLGGLEVANKVEDPPPLFIGAVAKDKERIVEMPLNRDETGAPIITPSRTKYQSRDLMEAPFEPIKEKVLLRNEKILHQQVVGKRRLFVPRRTTKKG
jgi:hypothetical protein